MQIRSLSFILACAFFIMACGGSQSLQTVDEGDIPSWYKNVPTDPNYLYAANTATSQDLQVALDKAGTGGRTEIGRQVEVKIEGLQKRFDQEIGIGKDAELLQQFTQASKNVVSTCLTGSKIKKQEYFQDGKFWRAYVLVEYPVGAANEALMQQIKSTQQMQTRFQSSQTFKDLEDEVKKYEQWKASQPTSDK